MKIAVFGASGKMGKEIAIASHKRGHSSYWGFSSRENVTLEGYAHVGSSWRDELIKNADIIFDFSLPQALPHVIEAVKEYRKPLVSGVTGYSDSSIDLLFELGQSVPCFWSPNFSLGIAILKQLVSQLAHFSEEFDFQIEEIHHNQKKDAPSGTAKLLQDALSAQLPSDKKGLIPFPVSIRGGGVFGDHRVLAMGQDEMLILEHRAMSRQLFATGAVKVAEWLVAKPKGVYKIDDYINDKLSKGEA